MKFNCAFCKQNITGKRKPYYDWRDTKLWIISCDNCEAKLSFNPSLSFGEKLFILLWETYMWIILILFAILLFDDSNPIQFELAIMILFPISMIIHYIIHIVYKNREAETKLVKTIG